MKNESSQDRWRKRSTDVAGEVMASIIVAIGEYLLNRRARGTPRILRRHGKSEDRIRLYLSPGAARELLHVLVKGLRREL